MTWCQVRCHPACAGRASQTHHRKLRKQGGTDDPENLLRVCAICHHDIHAQPARSYEHGWLVKSYDDPSSIPVKEAA